MSRNSEYEKRMKAQGFRKITLWIPDEMSAEFHQCASACRERPTLYFPHSAIQQRVASSQLNVLIARHQGQLDDRLKPSVL